MTKLIDLEPLRQTFRAINADPESHNQTVWGQADTDPREPACKTAFCVAGHMAVGAGWKPVWEMNLIYDRAEDDYVRQWNFDEVEKDGGSECVSDVAIELVVLDPEDWYSQDLLGLMFGGDKTPAEIQALAEELAERAGEPLGVVLLPDHPSHKETCL